MVYYRDLASITSLLRTIAASFFKFAFEQRLVSVTGPVSVQAKDGTYPRLGMLFSDPFWAEAPKG